MADSLDNRAIQALIPHRFPLLLVDRVLERDIGKRVVALKNVSAGEPFFQGHFPGHPVMPGVLIIEALAQTAALMVSEEDAETIPLFMGIDRARFRKQVQPGDQLRLEVEMLQSRRGIVKVGCKAYVGDDLAAEAEIMATLAPRDALG